MVVVQSVQARVEDFEQCFYLQAGLELRETPAGVGVFAQSGAQAMDMIVLERHIFAEDPAQAWLTVKEKLHPRSTVVKTCDGSPAQTYWRVELARRMEIAKKVQLNSYHNGLFDFGSKFNHDCDPNAARITWDDGFSVILALRPIRPGTQITVAYIETGSSAFWRKWALYTKHGFWCKCNRCITDGPQGTLPQVPDGAVGSVDLPDWERCLLALVASASEGLKLPRAVVKCKMSFECGMEGDAARWMKDAMQACSKIGAFDGAAVQLLQKALIPAREGTTASFDDAIRPAWRIISGLQGVVISFLCCAGVLVWMPGQLSDRWALLAFLPFVLNMVHALISFWSFEEHLSQLGMPLKR